MPTVRSICRKRGHEDPHTNLAVCDQYEAENVQFALDDVLLQIDEAATAIRLARESIKDNERDLALLVKEAFKYGGTGPELARATGLSRERIYQIRDGRR